MADLRVKICGLTSLQDALEAVEAGADLLGFNLYPRSPRYVEPQQVKELVSGIRSWISEQKQSDNTPNPPLLVGIFVDEPAERVAEILDLAALDCAQLHGGEPPVVLERLAPRAFKALRPSSAAEAQADAEWYGEFGIPDGPQLLIDAYDPNAYGGTGKKADWHAAAGLARIYPRLLVAGGLTPQNVAQAVRAVRPWGVDVSSGVEREPGYKDHAAVRAFISAAKGALS